MSESQIGKIRKILLKPEKILILLEENSVEEIFSFKEFNERGKLLQKLSHNNMRE